MRVGRAYGGGDPKAIAYAGWSAYALGVGFMALMGILMVLMPRVFIGIFLNLNDPQNLPVMELAVTFLALAALFQIVDGAQAVAAGMLRGLRDTRIPMLLLPFSAIGVSACRSARFWPSSSEWGRRHLAWPCGGAWHGGRADDDTLAPASGTCLGRCRGVKRAPIWFNQTGARVVFTWSMPECGRARHRSLSGKS